MGMPSRSEVDTDLVLAGLERLAAATDETVAACGAVGLRTENGMCTSLDVELMPSDQRLAYQMLQYFLDVAATGRNHAATTGMVLKDLSGRVADHNGSLFRSLLHTLCTLRKSDRPHEPSVWTLRPEFWMKTRPAR